MQGKLVDKMLESNYMTDTRSNKTLLEFNTQMKIKKEKVPTNGSYKTIHTRLFAFIHKFQTLDI